MTDPDPGEAQVALAEWQLDALLAGIDVALRLNFVLGAVGSSAMMADVHYTSPVPLDVAGTP